MTSAAGWPEPFASDELAGQVCLVTGAAQGIGAAIATRLAGLGATVVVTDLNEVGAREQAQRLRADGYAASAFALDVRSTEGIDAVVAQVHEAHGPIDVAINNAGFANIGESTDVTDEDWQLHIDVLLTGPFKVSRRVARDMLGRGSGSIVNICSIGGYGGHPQRTAYNAAKGGVKVMTDVLATEWASRGVRVNGVAPAVTRTEILEAVIERGSGRIRVEDFAGRTPLGRIADTHEIADTVVFLASSRASFVTGETFVVDGGWLASDGFPNPTGQAGAAGGR
jgi:3-oxoacyl-[acyl-carrier protein] reductase